MPQAQVALAWQPRRSERQTVHAPSNCSHCAKPGRLVLHGERAARLGTLISLQQLCSRSRPAPSPYLPSSPVCPRVKVSAKHATGGGHGAEVSGA